MPSVGINLQQRDLPSGHLPRWGTCGAGLDGLLRCHRLIDGILNSQPSLLLCGGPSYGSDIPTLKLSNLSALQKAYVRHCDPRFPPILDATTHNPIFARGSCKPRQPGQLFGSNLPAIW
ncbi:hypothetical protein B0T16DRAFT_187872 [Cercophora newfieldiana]|uniref:Uncharacterized protein n=1 Tax=Cercophora newfieldiana TaxID=92897 RepID=A0AA39Y0V1_9PEZI|nr:hypothetical protein B0T16DRAFT_187872 [Cercophora newfieldiana]